MRKLTLLASHAVIAGVLSACDDGAGAPGAGKSGAERPVCPRCVERSGGETSDFGDGSAYYPTGQGVQAPPSPCELSIVASSIDDDDARALGFGTALYQLRRSFELPLEWSALELTDGGRPARGYATSTSLRGSFDVVALEHLVPSLEGCEDMLRVGLAASFETLDGALSIADQLRVTVRRAQASIEISGYLDLIHARGTLDISPPRRDDVVGYVRVIAHLWPDATRLELSVGAHLLREVGSDVGTYSYQPLLGRAPVDDCDVSTRAIAFDQPTPAAGDQSLAQHFPALLRALAVAEPLPARWRGGAETTVTVELGEPGDVCEGLETLRFAAPVAIQTADGRVHMNGDGGIAATFLDGALAWAFVGLEFADDDLSPRNFANRTGISGVDFERMGRGMATTELTYQDDAIPQIEGALTVDGIDGEGTIAGVLDRLRWRLDEPAAP